MIQTLRRTVRHDAHGKGRPHIRARQQLSGLAAIASLIATLLCAAMVPATGEPAHVLPVPPPVTGSASHAGPDEAGTDTTGDSHAPGTMVHGDSFMVLAQRCAPGVAPGTLGAIVRTESSGNPFAIGIVGARLSRQPQNASEAIATARALEAAGYNFSLGLGQVNRYNLARYGESYETVFDPCRNLRAGAAILTGCYQRASLAFPPGQTALLAALSCYYAGNFSTGFQHGYVRKVLANASAPMPPVVPAILPGTTARGGVAHGPTVVENAGSTGHRDVPAISVRAQPPTDDRDIGVFVASSAPAQEGAHADQ